MNNNKNEQYEAKGGTLRSLPKVKNCTRHRKSSWDKTGGNNDRKIISPGETKEIGNISGSGVVTHIWLTYQCKEKFASRKTILRAFWDMEKSPSIEVPVGDFFGMGHSKTKNFTSLPFTMSPQDGRAFNCFFHMPFKEKAVFTITNECQYSELAIYYYIDYELYPKGLSDDLGKFHAQWRRENPTKGESEGIPKPTEENGKITNSEFQLSDKNKSCEDNYVILDAEGRGHYVGCNLNIHNLRDVEYSNWYGEGDDMIFIDEDDWPPRLHGTGTEDYFNTAWAPTQEFSAPFHGVTASGEENWSGRITLYRFHIEDPIQFSKNIQVTIEHGHANKRYDDYSSTAYWYQLEPHKKFPELLSTKERLP